METTRIRMMTEHFDGVKPDNGWKQSWGWPHSQDLGKSHLRTLILYHQRYRHAEGHGAAGQSSRVYTTMTMMMNTA